MGLQLRMNKRLIPVGVLMVTLLSASICPSQFFEDPFGRAVPSRTSSKFKKRWKSNFNEWSEAVDKVQIQIGSTKRVWGRLEKPVIKVNLKNSGTSPITALVGKEARLLIGGNEFRLVRPSVSQKQTCKAGETKNDAFLFRLDTGDWKPAAAEGEDKKLRSGEIGKLTALTVGKTHSITAQFVFESASGLKKISSKPFEIEISKAFMAFPDISGTVLDPAGKPIEKARVYLLGEGLANVNYSSTGEFKADRMYVNQYMSSRFGGFSSSGSLKFQTTDKSGAYQSERLATSSGLLVAADGYSPFYVPFNSSASEFKVRLPKPATLKIKYDIPGDSDPGRFYLVNIKTNNVNFSPYSYAYPGKDRVPFVFSSNMTVQSGKEITQKGLMPGTYTLRRMIYRRGSGRSSSRYVNKLIHFDLKAGEQKEILVSRKKGQQVEGEVFGFEKGEMDYAYVTVQPADEHGISGYKSTTIDWAITHDFKFKLPMISPGKYRFVAMGYKKKERPGGGFSYTQNLIGSKLVEIKDDKKILKTKIRVQSRDDWRTGNGYALDLKIIDKAKSPQTGLYIHKIVTGFKNAWTSRVYLGRTTTGGLAKLSVIPGTHRMVTGLIRNQPTFIEVKTPVMGERTFMLAPKLKFDKIKQEELKIVSSFSGEDKDRVISIKITNGSKARLEFKPEHLQLIYATMLPPYYGTTGYRCFLGMAIENLTQKLEPGKSIELKVNWNELVTKGKWCRLYGSNEIREIMKLQKPDAVAIKLGGFQSKPFEVSSAGEIVEEEEKEADSVKTAK